jgi:hypothetical protein
MTFPLLDENAKRAEPSFVPGDPPYWWALDQIESEARSMQDGHHSPEEIMDGLDAIIDWAREALKIIEESEE